MRRFLYFGWLVLLCTVRAQDAGQTHYSKLDQIHRGNVAQLKLLWQWKPGEEPLPEYKTTPGAFEATPIQVGKMLYLSTAYNRVVALDEESGREVWSYDPKAYVDGQVPNGTGFVHRGVGAWRDPKNGQNADRDEQPVSPDRTGRGEWKAGGRVRRQRGGEPGGRAALGNEPEELHEHIAGGDL
jgi:hypothetical protein